MGCLEVGLRPAGSNWSGSRAVYTAGRPVPYRTGCHSRITGMCPPDRAASCSHPVKIFHNAFDISLETSGCTVPSPLVGDVLDIEGG